MFQNLYFKYISNQSYILKNINLEIFKGEFIGIIGKTGDGKSTFIDLMMGLLKPSKGYIYLDNKNIHIKNNYKILRAWRKSISHVPQTINLFDSTIAENVAFGENANQINIEEVKNACRIAMIDEFISSLKDGYFTRVGELGKKLSGGQRQRIGIARALYSKSNILVFDEATSALDVITEKKILKSIISLKNNPTVIMIAHRLTTLKEADKLVEIEKGIIKKVTVRK